MNKQEAIIRFSAIMNRGIVNEDKTSIFEELTHQELIEKVVQYISLHSDLLGKLQIEVNQSLNDHGVDITIRVDEITKIGIQIKSFFDVREPDFARKVKSQLAESFIHGLDKWYLLICSPLKFKGTDYSGKINHLLNEISFAKIDYPCVFGPLNTVNIMKNERILEVEFYQTVQRYSYKITDIETILEALKDIPKRKRESLLGNVDYIKGYEPDSCYSISKLLDWDLTESGLKSTKESYLDLFNSLKQLTKTSREFLTAVMERSDEIIFAFEPIRALSIEIESYLNIKHERIAKEVNILRRYKFAEFEFEKHSTYIKITTPIDCDYELGSIKTYALKKNIPLKDIIVHLDFRLLD